MQYYNDKFNNNLHDAKSTWKVINKILKPNSKKQNDFQIENNGTKLSDSTEIANAFNPLLHDFLFSFCFWDIA